jgi:hypothetical protein
VVVEVEEMLLDFQKVLLVVVLEVLEHLVQF